MKNEVAQDNHVSVDEFLKDQSAPKFVATVEAIEGRPDSVKITPWLASSKECLCHMAIVIRKTALQGVTPTGDTHLCCGKTLKVVEVHFKQGETLVIEDVFNQLNEAAQKSAASQRSEYRQRPLPSNPMPGFFDRMRQGQGFGAPPPFNCFALHKECVNSCGSNICCEECEFYRLACLGGLDPCVPIHPPGWPRW
jgi:hypothetical protein